MHAACSPDANVNATVRTEDEYPKGPTQRNSHATVALVVAIVGIFVFGVVLGAGAYMIIAALFGLGIGLLTNSTTFGITIAIIWPLAVETALMGFAPDRIERFFPFRAGSALYQSPSGDLPPWEGGGIFLLWAAGLIFIGSLLFSRRDLGSSG